MHLGLKALEAFLADNRNERFLVLATVIATEGSTYRKPGAMLLANESGEFAGLISGGCLESDLVAQAQAVLESGDPARVDYDLKDDDELVLGLGLGCGGAVHLLLQRLDGSDGFQPLGALFHALERGTSCRLGLVVESDSSTLPAGACSLEASDGVFLGPDELRSLVSSVTLDVAGGKRARVVRNSLAGGEVGVLVVQVTPTPRVLVCGAGMDALPVIEQVLALGWGCTVIDHRPASVAAERLPHGAEGVCARPGSLADAVELDRIDAAVVMSHHVDHDAAYLSALATRPPRYLGMLGPRARRDQLLDTIGRPELRVRGPLGLDIGAELPESIALAIMAEIHACLNDRSGHPLDDG